MTERLTDEERTGLANGAQSDMAGTKALRIIDANAADRAALVAQVARLAAQATDLDFALTEARSARDRAEARIAEFVAQLEELSRERDEARTALADIALAAAEASHLCPCGESVRRKGGAADCRRGNEHAGWRSDCDSCNHHAAPSRAVADAPRCRECGWLLSVSPDGFGEAYTCARCDTRGKPATPARAEADQRVLDTMGEIPANTLAVWAAGPCEPGWLGSAAKAELARREASRD